MKELLFKLLELGNIVCQLKAENALIKQENEFLKNKNIDINHAIKTLKKERDAIEAVLTPFNKEYNPKAFVKSEKQHREIINAIYILELKK